MSDSNPTPEERNRIVDAVVNNMMSKSLLPKGETELEQLRNRRDRAVAEVRALIEPLVAEAIMLPSKHPLYAHSEVGRMTIIVQAQKFYVEKLRDFNREEALFFLALEYAERTVGTLL